MPKKNLNKNLHQAKEVKTDHLFYFIQDAVAGATYLIKVRGVTHYRQGEFSDVVEVEVV